MAEYPRADGAANYRTIMTQDEEEVDVESIDFQKVEELYTNGHGIKSIAFQLSVDTGRIKRSLVKHGLYRGAEHTVLPPAERLRLPKAPKVAVAPPSYPFIAEDPIQTIAYNPCDMLTWSRGDTTSIEAWERGYLVDFHQVGWIRCSLATTGRTVCWRTRARLLTPQLADLVLLLGDETGVERLTPSLRSSLDPRGNVWRISREIGQGGYIEIRYKDAGESLTTIFFSQLQIGEV